MPRTDTEPKESNISSRRRLLRKIGAAVHRFLDLPTQRIWHLHQTRVRQLPWTPKSEEVTYSELRWIKYHLLTDDYWHWDRTPNQSHPHFETIRRLTVGRDLTRAEIDRIDPDPEETEPADDPEVSSPMGETNPNYLQRDVRHALILYECMCDLQDEVTADLEEAISGGLTVEERTKLYTRYAETLALRLSYEKQLRNIVRDHLCLHEDLPPSY